MPGTRWCSPSRVRAIRAPRPTGLPRSPIPANMTKFSQPMPRFDVLTRQPVSSLVPAPTAQANTTQQAVDPALGGGFGPIEGRPPGPIWAHQGFTQFPPQVAYEVTMEGAKVNNSYNPGVPASLNSGINPANPVRPAFPRVLDGVLTCIQAAVVYNRCW